MRKINFLSKFKKKIPEEDNSPVAARITNETVAEYRERILAGGRRFKYPIHHNKRRIVVNSIIIVFIATILLISICWWQLYPVQNTSKFMYRVTQIAPFMVAKVDGEFVRYSDYLMQLRSAIHYLTTKEAVNFSSDDGKRQLDYQKRLALDKAIDNAYSAKLARENGIKITSKEVDDFVNSQIKASSLGVSEADYKKVISDYYDWSFSEYKSSVRAQLIRKKVVAKIDTASLKVVNDILAQVKGGSDFIALTKQFSDDSATKGNGGDLGFVPKTSDDPNGILRAADKLSPGQVSDVISGVDGYYLVKLLEKRDNDLRIAKLVIYYKEFDKRLIELKAGKKIEEFISIPESTPGS